MTALALPSDFAATMAEIFQPIDAAPLRVLFDEYAVKRASIVHLSSELVEHRDVVSYFVDGNCSDLTSYGASLWAGALSKTDGAIAALNADYWRRTLELTDVRECMPQARRDEWDSSIQGHKTPDFDEPTVLATLADLLASRERFFAERVDGIFRALSGEHVTNSPLGFRKRMIIVHIHSGSASYGYLNYRRAGVVNDLRAVVARFMGRDAPHSRLTNASLEYALNRRCGKWVELDGGALKVRVYKKGTAHLEVHPEIAWRLNAVLASLYPSAIASKDRQRPKRASKAKAVTLLQRPLPFAVLDVLRQAKVHGAAKTLTLDFSTKLDKHMRREVDAALFSLGATRKAHDERLYSFDYDPTEVIGELLALGCLPEQKSHQYYPTPESVARQVIELADVQPGETCLEPSAGQGALADHLPTELTACVEVSPMHCKILRAKELDVVEGDFLEVKVEDVGRVDVVVMNPPFSGGRWRAHVEHAAEFVEEGGRLVAVLPSSAASVDVLPGWTCSWSAPISGEFAGTSISVVILRADRPAS